MRRALAWLGADGWLGIARWRWLVALAGPALLAIWWGWAAIAAVPAVMLALVPRPRVPTGPGPSVSHAAQEAHRARQEADAALARVGEEASARADVAREAARTDPLDEVAARIEADARRRP